MKRRVVILFVDDTDAVEDLTGALNLLQGPSYLPFPDDWTPQQKRDNPQPQMDDELRREIALQWLWRSRDRIHHGQTILLPHAWKVMPDDPASTGRPSGRTA